MPSIGVLTKYLGLLSIGKGLIDKTVFQRLLSGIAAVVGLSVIAGLLVGAIVIGLLGLQYYTIISAGYSQTIAIIVTALTISLIVAVLVYKIIQITKQIASYSALLAQPASPVAPITDAVSDVFNAFVKGFRESSASKNAALQQPGVTNRRKYPKSVK